MTTIKIVNVATGEELERPMTKDELKDLANDQAILEAKEQAALDLKALKASAKAKLIAGQPLTEAEANTLVI